MLNFRSALIALILFASVFILPAQRKNIFPPGTNLAGPYSPGVIANGYLYVSGQGAKSKAGKFPESTGDQTRQTLDNVREIVEAAGLTMDHLVYAQVYATNSDQFADIDTAWKAYFPKGGPARALLGVAKLPQDTPVEINAVAVIDLGTKEALAIDANKIPGAMIAGGRVYISDCAGLDPITGAAPSDPEAQVKLALDRMSKILKSAGIDFRHMIFVNPYMTDQISYEAMNRAYASRFEFGNTPARATIQVASLPKGANIHFTGVAVRDLSKRRAVRPRNMDPSPTASPCVLAGTSLFCSAKSGFIPGPHGGLFASTVETQVRQTMRNLLDGLEEAGLSLSNVVSTNVYLDVVAVFPKMNRIYALYFPTDQPSRTTVQQRPSVVRASNEKDEWPTLEQISLIAER